MINLFRHRQHLTSNLHLKILQRSQDRFANPKGINKCDWISPSAMGVSKASASEVGRQQCVHRQSWAGGEITLRIPVPYDTDNFACAMWQITVPILSSHQISSARFRLACRAGWPQLRRKLCWSTPLRMSGWTNVSVSK